MVEAQINYLTTDATASATDNELALLWRDYYPRQHWLMNPLSVVRLQNRISTTLMVMRLDGPDPAAVRRIMQTSVEVEKTGLKGIVAIDARGLSPIDDKGNSSAFGQFDQTLRNLAYFIRVKTNLKIRLDDQDLVFPPHSVNNVALIADGTVSTIIFPAVISIPERSDITSPALRWSRFTAQFTLGARADQRRRGGNPWPGGRAVSGGISQARRILSPSADRQTDHGRGLLENHADDQLDDQLHWRPAVSALHANPSPAGGGSCRRYLR